jgi:hypothetical protein
VSAGEGWEKQLEALTQLVVVPPDPLAKVDAQDAKLAVAAESKFYEDDLHQQEMADRNLSRAQREGYARRIFVLVCVWIALVFLLLLAQGFGDIIHYKPLGDNVLIALVSSTTVNMIGTLVIVLKYIFKVPTPHHSPPSIPPQE